MSLVKKIKEILFEEEEVTEAIKPVKPINEIPREVIKEQPRIETPSEPVTEAYNPPKTPSSEVSERDLFKMDNSFKFPDFDEEEFKSSMPKRTNSSNKTSNVLEYERKKSSEKRNDFGRLERVESRDTIDKRKFKPSPIISPVYGILNLDYTPEDVKNKEEMLSNTLDLEEVRKRAFESEEIILEEPEKIDEPVVTFFGEKESFSSPKNKPEEMKSIDELLESASEEEISLEDELEMPNETNIDEIEEQLGKYDAKEELTKEGLDDTLESDLFELIDSMYDTREESE